MSEFTDIDAATAAERKRVARNVERIRQQLSPARKPPPPGRAATTAAAPKQSGSVNPLLVVAVLLAVVAIVFKVLM